MVLKLTYLGQTSIPVELEGLTPDWACDKTSADIEQFEIFHGNQKLRMAELFRVLGDASDKTIEIEGNLSGVHWIGAKMESGTIRIQGSAGRHLGSGMRGGQIIVEGNVSDWAGAEMHAGSIQIRGDAGHLLGSAYRGSTKGMTGGEILVDGRAGDEVGLCMRRGLIAIGGAAGQFLGGGMIAGTILVFGDCGIRPGAGMRRGTLGLFGPNPPPLLPTFRHAATYRPQFIPLILKQLRERAFAFNESLMESEFNLYHGDLVSLGRGEILIPHTNGRSD